MKIPMITKIKIAVVALIILSGLGGWLYLQNLRADNFRLEEAARAALAEVGGLESELAANRAALAAREAERATLSRDNAALMKKLEEVYENDKDAKAWACSRLPDGVLDCLRP